MSLMDDAQQMVKVGIRDDDGQVETLWATPIDQHLYRLENSPFRAYGISWLDMVRAEADNDGVLFFVSIAKKSGHRTIRVIVEKDSNIVPTLLSQLKSLGCTCEGAFSRLIVINVPPEVELHQVADYLISTELQWEYADPTYEEVASEQNKKG